MPPDRKALIDRLKKFDFTGLFTQELGWDWNSSVSLRVNVGEQVFDIRSIAQKRGIQVFECRLGRIPDYATRRLIDKEITKSAYEHLIIFTDSAKTVQIWQWVSKEPGKPKACREYTFTKNQSGEALIQRLNHIAFALSDEEGLTLIGATIKLKDAFDKERITKRFYERFQKELQTFKEFLQGIPQDDMENWYASVMMSRLMFIYFIQKKEFLNNDLHYLRNQLECSRQRGKDRFYKDFLCPLFFEGFAKPERERSQAAKQLLGKIPYLNGGLFLRHQIEELYGEAITIQDAAFEKLFAFFDQYQWHLDERPNRADNEINPDVLGYIFEKYINQKQMGAYYTKEDITEYISKNTIIPRLFDEARRNCKIAFEGEKSVWELLQADPDRYIYEAVRLGVIDSQGQVIPETALPEFVQKGMRDPKERMFDRRYNLGDAYLRGEKGEKLTLPTETWREYVCRRQRCLELRDKLAQGEAQDINALVTYNLNIRQFAQDAIENCEGPELLRAFWRAIRDISVLDPTCGSGAFLFAALNILEDLYEACLDRMQAFLDELERLGEKHRPEKYKDFREILALIEKHPNRKYFVFKSIILNNLYGVDIMDEAVEICKLRLFLKLVAQVEKVNEIEPLPDIDFNIQAGNTLVGFTTLKEVKNSLADSMLNDEIMQSIADQADEIDRLFVHFKEQQTSLGGEITPADKQELRRRLKQLEDELNRYLAGEYGIQTNDEKGYEKWLASHKPFHWLIEFYGIMKKGGFDVIIGNPPYVELSPRKVEYNFKEKQYETLSSKNLYSLVYEHSLNLIKRNSYVGFIVQLTAISSEKMAPLQDMLLNRGGLLALAFPRRPESIFDGVEMPVSILISCPWNSGLYTTRINRFYTEERSVALTSLNLHTHNIRINKHRIAKFGNMIDVSVYGKIAKNQIIISDNIGAEYSKWFLYYQEAFRYWAKACKGHPFFRRNGKDMQPPHGRIIKFTSYESCSFTTCLINSSLFYWYYSAFSDCEHLNDSLLKEFKVPDNCWKFKWINLEKELSLSLSNNAVRKNIKTKQGHKIEYDEINGSKSKSTIDNIDRVLAQHYGFTDEELDFIINYDIKYRMGREGGEEAE
ncbi:MAG: DNA methyltransferase [Candidatus Omnitrophota bacterium]